MEKGIKHLLHNIREGDNKAFCLLATSYKGAWANGMTLICNFDMDKICVASRGRQTGGDGQETTQHLEPCPVEGKTNCLTTVAKDNLILQRPRGKNAGKLYTEKSPAVTSNAWQENNLEDYRIRRLTPTECARLQTIPGWYKWQCSKTQQYKMLGNGWTVEVIKHIFSYLPNELMRVEATSK